MNLKEYQAWTPETFLYSSNFDKDIIHSSCGLFAEAGEVAGVYQKYHRGDFNEDELHKRLRKELGGLMYYICMTANLEGIKMEEVLEENKNVLLARKAKGTIQGDGDVRE